LIIEPIEVMGVDMLAFDAAGIGIGHRGVYLAS
jgi:hypothetical protein